MATTTKTSRMTHLIELMTNGDNFFNARNWQELEDVHHPDMIAYMTGSADPIYGREAHGTAMQQLVEMFPDVRVQTHIRSSTEATTGSRWSPTSPGRSPGR